MPQDTSQQSPQLDPAFDYAKLPDGSYAKFTKGTSEAEMRGRLMAAGKLPPTPVTPPKGQLTTGAKGYNPAASQVKSGIGLATDYAKEIVGGVYRGGKSVLTYPFEAGQKRPGDEKMGIFSHVPSVRMGVHSYQDLFGALDAASAAEKQSKQSGENRYGQFLSAAEKEPIIGPIVTRAEQGAVTAGPGMSLQTHAFTPKQLGATSELATMLKGPEYVVDKATGMVDSQVLRDHAARLDNKVLKTAQAGAKGYKLSTALQVAKEGIYGTMKSLPDQIEAKRTMKNQQVQALAKQLDTQGKTVDITQEIAPIARDVMSVSNQRGTLTPQLRTQIGNLLKRVTTETDMQTGATRTRNLSQMKIGDAMALQKGLEDLSAFGKQVPDAINNLARRLRGVLGDKLNQASPEMQRLRGEESSLITARDAARKNYAEALNSGRAGARGFIYSSLPTAGVYVGLKALGLPFAGAIGTALVLRTLAESVPSRTFRAAMYAKAADALDAALRRNTGPQGASPTGTALTPTSPQIGPQVGPNARLTGSPQGAGPAAPTAPASVVSTNPARGMDTVPTAVAPPRGTMLPERATRARAGSGDYVKGEKPNVNVAKSNTKTAEPMATGPNADPRMKAMMDRLDNLYERQASPKSGADRNAIEREIAEIKRVLSGEAKGADASAIAKRIADRERLATKRGEAKAASPGTQTGSQTGSTSEPATRPEASPENRAMILDLGYKKLASYDGGPEMVKAMQKLAKDMRGKPDYDEVTALTDALNAMREVSGK